jgi:putative tricarboxylic transport membrane protein
MAPLVLALVLGDMAENAFRQSLLSSSGSMGVFFSNPLVGSITTLALIMLVWPAVTAVMAKLKGTSAA